MFIEASDQHLQWARRIGSMAWEYRAARAVQAAHHVGVFAQLAHDEPATTGQLAERLQLDAGMLEKVLIAMAAMELVERVGDGWRLTEPGRVTFDPDSPLYQGQGVAHMMHVWDTWSVLPQRLRGESAGVAWTDQPAPRSDHGHVSFIMAMHSYAVAGRADRLLECVDLSAAQRLLDVGGGPGTYSMAMLKRYRQLTATLFDLPQTIAIARANIERFGMTDRYTFVEGNWNDDPFGEGFDAVLMSNILHGPTDATEMKLAKAHAATRPGGTLIVQDFMLNDDRTGPLAPALFNIMVGAWTVGELSERIASAGYTIQSTTAMPADWGTTVIVARRLEA